MNSFGFIREACNAMNIKFDIPDLEEIVGVGEVDYTSESKSVQDLNEVAGGVYWQKIIEDYKVNIIDGYEAEKRFTEEYCSKLSSIFTYVLNMPIRLKKGQRPKYRMIHATNHEDGCVLMNDNKGIPDDPWYISPGKEGQSIQYMPKFQPKDWLIRYWFSYFSEAVYFKLFSIWDSIVGLINEYYQMDHVEDLRFKTNVMKSLKSQRNDIVEFMSGILEEQIYKDANMYRTKIVHGATPNDVSSGVGIKRNTDVEVIDKNGDGTLKLTDDGKVIMKKVKASIQISGGVEEYTGTKIIMDNIKRFSEFTGEKIKTYCRYD